MPIPLEYDVSHHGHVDDRISAALQALDWYARAEGVDAW